jgi:outer membrane protein
MRLKIWMTALCLSLSLTSLEAAAIEKVGIVNFKYCVDQSKAGKKEQENFEKMKTDMESSLGEKEKEMNELSAKLNDEDYMDTLSDKAEADLKHKFRTITQQIQQEQARFYQMLNQAQYKVVQKLQSQVANASKKVAEQMGLTQVFNQEVMFYFEPSLDISDKVVKELDADLENAK